MSAAEKSLVQRERTLPGLETLLDPEAFVRSISAGADVQILGAQRRYIRYKPAMNCVVAYRVQTELGGVEVYGKAHGSDAQVKFAKIRGRTRMRSAIGPGSLLLAEPSIAVWFFPNDGKLVPLAEIVEPETRRARLAAILPRREEVEESRLREIQYKPERRYVGRLEHDGEPWGVLKLYTREGYVDARRRLLAFRDGAVLRVPRMLGKESHSGIVICGWIPGRLLSEALRDPVLDVGGLASVGAALAELHHQEPRDRIPIQHAQDRIAHLLELAETLGTLLPRLASQARRLAQRLVTRLADELEPCGPVHGDFYAKQVVLGPGQVALLDLDSAAVAHPLVDLGVFLAHIERDVLRGTLASDRREPIARALLEGYGRASADLPLHVYTALGLFRLAHDPFRHCEPGWAERTEALLGRTAEILDRSGAGPWREGSRAPRAGPRVARVPVSDPLEIGADPKMRFLSEAITPESVERELAASVLPNHRFELRAIRVKRYRPKRRCVIEYDVAIEGSPWDGRVVSLIGKVRAKGLDRTAFEVSNALRSAGLGAEGPVAVPEPLGTIPGWRMWVQLKAPGVPVTRLLPEPGGVELAARVAEAIHALHQAAVPSMRTHTIADEIRILHERLPEVAESHLEWADRIEQILAACRRLGESRPGYGVTGIHRDFYPDHVLADGQRLQIIDLDLYCQGEGSLDVGNFSAHLIELGLRVFDDPLHLEAQRCAFEERYLERAGEALRPAVDTYRTLSLVRHIHISTLVPKRSRLTGRLLELAEEAALAPTGAGS
ncbi:MAG: phosphotransferase family protein [Myxococcota bacterium]